MKLFSHFVLLHLTPEAVVYCSYGVNAAAKERRPTYLIKGLSCLFGVVSEL